MAHSAPKGTPNFDTRLVFVIGLCAAMMFFAIMVAIWAGFEFVWTAEVYKKQYAPAYPELVEHTAEQDALLDGSTEGTIAIDDAMKIIVERAANQQHGG